MASQFACTEPAPRVQAAELKDKGETLPDEEAYAEALKTWEQDDFGSWKKALESISKALGIEPEPEPEPELEPEREPEPEPEETVGGGGTKTPAKQRATTAPQETPAQKNTRKMKEEFEKKGPTAG